MAEQVVKLRRATIAACMTCPICNKLLKEATTISLCLHTFCRKCIYEKLSDEESDCCPVCDIDLGCIPVEKLRPDHNLQDIRAKVFPLRRRKVDAAEVVPSVTVPAKRKERSLSSLVVSTPTVAAQTGLTGRRTKSKKAAALLASHLSSEKSIKKERDNSTESSSSPETLNKIVNKRRAKEVRETAGTYTDRRFSIDGENDVESSEGKADMWTPLNYLLEVANRTKPSKLNSEGVYSAKSDSNDVLDNEMFNNKSKAKSEISILSEEYMFGSEIKENELNVEGQDNKNRRLHAKERKMKAASRRLIVSPQVVLDAAEVTHNRRKNPIWFSLVASENREGDTPLRQLSPCYLRIQDGSMPISFIQKYLVKKLDLTSESEVEILLQDQPVLPTLQLHSLVDLWLQTTATSERISATVGTSAKDFVMVLSYARRTQDA